MAAVLFVSLALAACSGDARTSRRSGRSAASPATGNDSAAGTVELGSPSYSPAAVERAGDVAGTIRLDGPPPPKTVPVTIDQGVCGTSAPGPVVATARGLSNAIVWIAGVTSGKALPPDKRVELASEDCVLDPRVQATVVGATVNVFNDDEVLHRLVFTRLGTHDTLTVMPFFDNGQIVASERLARTPGIVDVRCARHPWTRAYIAVFDQPYFAVTAPDGSFKIDALPAGTYTVMVWHEGMTKPAEQRVKVAAGGTARVDLAVKVAD